jgi:hypothetical protein
MIRRTSNARRPRPTFGDRLTLRWSTSKIVDGLWIGAYFQWNADEEQGLQRIEQALGLIKTYDPIRYRRLLRDLERVWALMIPYNLGQFEESLWACKLDQRFVLDEATTVEQIAASIVHEATHARLARCGIGYDEPIRHRVELICVRSEMAFATRIPDGNSVWDEAERSLERCSSPDHWTDEVFTANYMTGATQALQHHGVPSVLIRMTIRFIRWRLAARRFLRSLQREQRI